MSLKYANKEVTFRTQSATEEPDQSVLNFTINYDDYGKEEFLSVEEITSGCSQYFALGKYYPYNVIDLLVKGIFRIESFNAVNVIVF
jgi:hypothetical protein